MKITYHSFDKDPEVPSRLDEKSERDYLDSDAGEPPKGANW